MFKGDLVQSRVEWIDHVKGITIVMVVAHHVLEGLHSTFHLPDVMYWYAMLSPVRMPLFFLVAGIFARKAIEAPLRNFVDGKVLHFLYFYLLWSFIVFAFRYGLNSITNNQTRASEILAILWDPLPTIWFLYALLLAFAVARVFRSIAPGYLIAFAAVMQAETLTTHYWGPIEIVGKLGYLMVYFLIGMYCSEWIRSRAEQTNGWYVLVGASCFLAIALVARHYDLLHEPPVYFVLSALSALAIVSGSVLAVRRGFGWLFSFIGAGSLYIYLTHFLPAAGVRIVMIRLGIDAPGMIFPVAVVAAVAFGIIFYQLIRETPLRFLVERPPLFRTPIRLQQTAAQTES